MKESKLSAELSANKINKTQLRKDIMTMSEIHTTAFKPAVKLPQNLINFMNRGIQEGKLFNQVRAGYMFWSYKFGCVDQEANKFFNTDTYITTKYCKSIMVVNDHINAFSNEVKAMFESEATAEVLAGFKALEEFKAQDLLTQLMGEAPTLLLLQEQDLLGAKMKLNEYQDEDTMKRSEYILNKLALRRGDEDLIVSYKATEGEIESRKLKSYLPSQWLAFKVLEKLVDISNRGTLTKNQQRELKRMLKAEQKVRVLALYTEGKTVAQIASLEKIGATKVRTIIKS